MNSLTKRITSGICVATCALSLCFGLPRLISAKTTNAADVSQSYTYFYDNLTVADSKGEHHEYTLAKKFYRVLDELNKSGDFKDGVVDYSLTANKILTSAEVEAYVEGGDITIPRAFGAARDAYLTDHPELFYVDFYKLTISAGRTNGVYSAYIDSGREANIYHDNGFDSKEGVESAIKIYNEKINEIAEKAIAEAEKDTYGTQKAVLQARYVNSYLADTIEYDYGSYNDFIENGTTSAAVVSTAYGALVNNVAVCGGYSFAYKAVMDKLGIPCVVVNGYGLSEDEKGNATENTVMHAWNYIYLPDPVEETEGAKTFTSRDAKTAGNWYAVDVTWNSTGRDKNKYMNMGSYSLQTNHIVDGVISSSKYELQYPELSLYNYGCNTNSNGLVYGVEYVQSDDMLDSYGNPYVTQWEYISYNGMGAQELVEKEGLHLIVRYAYFKDGNLKWTVWQDIDALIKYGGLADGGIIDDGHQVKIYGNASTIYTQFAVIDRAPDLNKNPDSIWANEHNLFYDYANTPADDITVISEVFENKSFGTYVAAPYVRTANYDYRAVQEISDGMRAHNSNIMDEKYAKIYEVTYYEPLRILNEDEDIGIFVTGKHSNILEYAKLLPLPSGKMVEMVDEYTLRFKFLPSLMYEHNGELYTFTFTNVGSNLIRQRPKRDENNQIIHDKDGNVVTEDYTSDKLPNTVSYEFARTYILCSKYFGYDGRLYIDCCAQPELVDNSDLSAMDFKDEEGNSTFSESERSQMMLVVNTMTPEAEENMLDEISNNSDIDIKKEDIKKSETYDIRLQICNKYPTISDGSYVRISLGFPEGYGPEDEGVTFKLFHRKHISGDEYIIEEIPCVVTQFGIVATVTSFSPYMVAVVDADKASTDKTIYASIEGKGGKLTKEDGQIISLKEGESHEYTILPEEGFSIYSVLLNGEDVTSQVRENKLTVSYEQLKANNEIEIRYISNVAKERYEEKEIVDPVKILISTDGLPPIERVQENKSSNALIISLSVVGAIVVVGAVSMIVIRNKKNKVSK